MTQNARIQALLLSTMRLWWYLRLFNGKYFNGRPIMVPFHSAVRIALSVARLQYLWRNPCE